MKSPQFLIGPIVAAVTLLSACGGGSNGVAPPAAEQPSVATLAANSERVELTAEGAETFALAITNKSAQITARSVAARLPADWVDVKQDASDCVTLAPQATCSLIFTPGATSRPATDVVIEGENLTPLTMSFSIGAATTAPLGVEHTPLSLTVGESGGKIVVTNRSTSITAKDIVANLAGTPLADALKQEAGHCASVAPGASCSLKFYPGTTPVSSTSFVIRGSNTNPVGGTIEIKAPTSATLSVSGSPLVLQADSSSPAVGHIIVTNTSSIVANQVSAKLAGTALENIVVQDDSHCTSIAPGAQCQLNFTPSSTALAATNIVIQGANTSQVAASIAVNAIRPTLSVTGSPLTLLKDGAARSLTITNTSTTETALNVDADLTGTALAGHVTVSGNNCASLAPSATCTIQFTPGPTVVGATSFTIAGSNTQTLTATIKVRDIAIGDSYQGGTVIRVPSAPVRGLIITPTTMGPMQWSPDSTATPAANSLTDGVPNTAALVLKYGPGTYAAGYCDALTRVDDGVSYEDWYLPATDEAAEFSDAYRAIPSAFPGVNRSYVFTSNEYNPSLGQVVSMHSHATFGGDTKTGMNAAIGVHCARKFD